MVPDRQVAVVSLPATIKASEFIRISTFDIPLSLLFFRMYLEMYQESTFVARTDSILEVTNHIKSLLP
jgi:hypothetical protein